MSSTSKGCKALLQPLELSISCREALKPLHLGCISAVQLFCSHFEALHSAAHFVRVEDDCEDVFTGGLLKRYAKRPVGREHLTLADWAAWYDSCSSTYVRQSKQTDIDHLPFEA